MKVTKLWGSLVLAGSVVLTAGCGGEEKAAGIDPKIMADSLFAVMASDRANYTKLIIKRLGAQGKFIKPDEHWEDIGIKLSEANKYFFSIPANKWVGDVESKRLMFGVTRFTFKDAGEVLLQSEWQDALPVEGNINKAKLNS